MRIIGRRSRAALGPRRAFGGRPWTSDKREPHQVAHKCCVRRSHDSQVEVPFYAIHCQDNPAAQFPQGRNGRRRQRRCAGIPDDRQRPDRPGLDALAEHLAVEGHLPRIRARLCEEGERHDGRRPQDRGIACGRCRAGVRPHRRSLERHPRRRARRARLSLWQAECPRAMGIRSRVRDGRQHAAVLAQVWRRQGTADQALRVPQPERGLVPLRTAPDPAARLVQEADHQGR